MATWHNQYLSAEDPDCTSVMAVLKLACVLVLCSSALALDGFDNSGFKVAIKLYEDCSKTDAFSPCLKKKALTFFDRLSRMDKFSVTDGVIVVKDPSAVSNEPVITEEKLENALPRGIDAQDEVLNNMLIEKVGKYISSRTVEVALPKLIPEELGLEEGRKKKGNMMGSMMMGIAAKMAALIPIAIAGLFLLAGKALITAKIALLLAGIIAIKKLFASKQGGGGGHSSGGWQSSGGGGWDRRSLEEAQIAQNLAYKAYVPK